MISNVVYLNGIRGEISLTHQSGKTFLIDLFPDQ